MNYEINERVFYAIANNDELQTEALAFVLNAEGNVDDNISEIEQVFLYYVNKPKDEE